MGNDNSSVVRRNFRTHPITKQEQLECVWYVTANDTIGGWIIANVNKPESQLDHYASEFEIACFMSKEVAEHIVNLHNTWWANYVDDTYSGNIMTTYNRELEECYIQAALDKPDPTM